MNYENSIAKLLPRSHANRFSFRPSANQVAQETDDEEENRSTNIDSASSTTQNGTAANCAEQTA